MWVWVRVELPIPTGLPVLIPIVNGPTCKKARLGKGAKKQVVIEREDIHNQSPGVKESTKKAKKGKAKENPQNPIATSSKLVPTPTVRVEKENITGKQLQEPNYPEIALLLGGAKTSIPASLGKDAKKFLPIYLLGLQAGSTLHLAQETQNIGHTNILHATLQFALKAHELHLQELALNDAREEKHTLQHWVQLCSFKTRNCSNAKKLHANMDAMLQDEDMTKLAKLMCSKEYNTFSMFASKSQNHQSAKCSHYLCKWKNIAGKSPTIWHYIMNGDTTSWYNEKRPKCCFGPDEVWVLAERAISSSLGNLKSLDNVCWQWHKVWLFTLIKIVGWKGLRRGAFRDHDTLDSLFKTDEIDIGWKKEFLDHPAFAADGLQGLSVDIDSPMSDAALCAFLSTEIMLNEVVVTLLSHCFCKFGWVTL
ncbi:hypothetical protein BV22DRAFT_1051040 [Leucogyrophana mollusca]|uniref:Uncharacterized protein n=1 Tax=Leucogyrophana mollusca TaxID=85980 RepID=A0ACB8B117_9AGAM|nr:hypothetical protein BV22DRAFT_1051040 [Leucogyrophana mollusca]